MVVWDAARADHLTPYGYRRDTTPTLTTIAREATVFEQALAAAPWTLPSVASLFTGLHVHNHKVSFEPKTPVLDLPEAAYTLAEALRDAGYATALFTAQRIFYRKAGFLQGFDQHRVVPESELASEVLGFVDQARPKPAFVVSYWLNPHAPYEPPPEHDHWSEPLTPPVDLASGEDPSRPGYLKHDDINSGRIVLTDQQWAQLQAKYDGELRANDAALNKLWNGLRARGIADHSLFVFTSDHGEGFNEHPRQRVWHELPYETTLRVPLIIRLPGKFPKTRVRSAVRSIDLYPTILEVAGVALRGPINGESLLPTLSGQAADRPLIGASHFKRGIIFYRANGHKLFYSRHKHPRTEVYDLANDPQESHNLAASRPDLVDKLQKELQTYLSKTQLDLITAPSDRMNSEDRERLRALGYGP